MSWSTNTCKREKKGVEVYPGVPGRTQTKMHNGKGYLLEKDNFETKGWKREFSIQCVN
jgi:hypothetical protein